MARISDLTNLCKSGKLNEAYDLAKAGLASSPQDIWAQRGIGWVIYYLLKNDIVKKQYKQLFARLDELSTLQLLTMQNDALIFEKVIWKLADFIKGLPKGDSAYIDRVFEFVRKYTFLPSKGYSYFLKTCIHFDGWQKLLEFIEWWNLDNLLAEDYQDFMLDNGKKVMSLAEQAYIAYSKALLKLRDNDKIRSFIPQIEALMDKYPNMMYPGYFCGKLMLALGAAKNEALKIVMPFVRKKKNDFWVWQLLSEIYKP